MTTLITFDVDGTLIHSLSHKSNWLHKQAFIHCFKDVYGIETNIDVVKHHGGTDPLIIKAVLEHHGIDGADVMRRMKELQDSMIKFARDNEAQAAEGLEILPGVSALLRLLRDRSDCITGLVTGNLEPIAWLKMSHLGLLELFTSPPMGGFGTDFCSGNTAEMWRDRQVFVEIAGTKADEICAAQGLPPVARRVHVGDTPFDIKAAVGAGAYALGVATGIFSRAELEEVLGGGDGIILDSLEDIPRVLAAVGLKD